MRILVAEQDQALGTFLERSFDAENYHVDLAANSEVAKAMADAQEYDVAIFDLNLAAQEGMEILRHVRLRRESLPILVLSNRTRPEERAQALDLGADDLVVKPFAFSELSARVRAMLRRGKRTPETVLCVDDLELNRVERTVNRGGRRIELTPKEFGLLEHLMRNAGQRVTRAQIIQQVWNLSFDTMTNVVDVYINYLRKKVDNGAQVKLIHTIRGVGYKIEAAQAVGRGAA
ncbi:MAG: winged helix-turn-helix domain-containing protein [Candidatus Acidiferrales bacterium]